MYITKRAKTDPDNVDPELEDVLLQSSRDTSGEQLAANQSALARLYYMEIHFLSLFVFLLP